MKQGIGKLVLPFGLSTRTVHAGSFYSCPAEGEGYLRIKLAPEVPGTYDYLIPIKDFGVPESPGPVYAALNAVLKDLAEGAPVYVGCMGGWGRTGTFLALLAKSLGIADPVAYVRTHYDDHAVERDSQHDYIADFDTAPLRKAVLHAKLLAGYTDVLRWTRMTIAPIMV